MDRAHKTVLWIEKFRCQNSNLNLPTIKNGFCRFSYPQDRLHIQNRIQAQFWNPWVMPVTMVCLYSATTQYTWRTSTQRDIRLAARTFGKANPGYPAREVGRSIACSMRGGQKQVQTFNFRLKWVSYRVDTIKIRKSSGT